MIGGLQAPHLHKVLITTDAVGGVWSYSVDLAATLSARRVEVVLAVVGPPPSAGQRAETPEPSR